MKGSSPVRDFHSWHYFIGCLVGERIKSVQSESWCSFAMTSTLIRTGRLLSGPVRLFWRSYVPRFYGTLPPGASSSPGFLTAERMEELSRRPKPFPEPLQTLFPSPTDFSQIFKPKLTGSFRTTKDLGIFSMLIDHLTFR